MEQGFRIFCLLVFVFVFSFACMQSRKNFGVASCFFIGWKEGLVEISRVLCVGFHHIFG